MFAALLPVTYLLQAEIYYSQSGLAATEAFLAHRTGLIAIYAVLCLLVSLASKLNVTLHIRAAAAERAAGRRKAAAAAALRGGGAAAAALLAVEMDYLPICGNLATVVAYGLCVDLNIRYLGGSIYCVLLLSPMMLLLSRGRKVFTALDDSTRYAPVVSAVLGSLAIGAASELFHLLDDPAAELAEAGGFDFPEVDETIGSR